jgi:hypothetical protein
LNSSSEEFAQRMNINNNNNWNQNPNQESHQRRKNNDNTNNQKATEAKDENKQAPLKYEMRKVKDPPIVDLKFIQITRTIKESMIVYDDGTPEEIVELVIEFQYHCKCRLKY